MTDNLIATGKKDEEIFLKDYPDKVIEAAEYIDRMDKAVKFTGVIPEPKADSNVTPGEEDLYTVDEIKQFINETETTYRLLKEATKEFSAAKHDGFETDNVYVPRGISELYLIGSGVYNKRTIRSLKTSDAIIKASRGYPVVSSKVTFILSIAAMKMQKEKVNFSEEVKSLLTTIVNTFHPNIAGELIIALDSVNLLYYLLGDERLTFIRQLYETLVMREGIFITQDKDYFTNGFSAGFTTEDLIGYKMGRFVFDKPEQLLDDKNHFNWFDTIFNVPAYENFKKSIYTDILFDMIYNDESEGSTLVVMNKANRIIRQAVTDWIKAPDLSKRPEQPEPFQYINMPAYLKSIYSHALHTIGDMDAYIGSYEAAKESTEKEYKAVKEAWDKEAHEKKMSEEDKEKLRKELHSFKESKDKAYSEYLEHLREKSHIEFLFLEILGNEKVVEKAFDLDLIAYILAFEPDPNNAAQVIHAAVTSLYCKRDFMPLGISAINPYYIHASQGDIISPESKWFARAMSGIANYNMGSHIACAFINLPTEAANVITNVEHTMMKDKIDCALRARFYAKSISISERLAKCDFKAKGVDVAELIELTKTFDITDGDKVNKIVVAASSIIKLIEAGENKPSNPDEAASPQDLAELSSIKYKLTTLKDALIEYVDTDWGFKNIYNELARIFERLGNSQCIPAARADIEADIRQYSWWPRTVQYLHKIVDEDEAKVGKSREETAHENYLDLKPGDLQSGRFKVQYDRLDDRFSNTNPCD